MKKKKLVNKQAFKKGAGKCHFCGEDEYELLDTHRIVPGSDGGTYHELNILPLCALCHRKTHSDIIKIDRKYFKSDGTWVVHYWENGVEFWK